MNGPAQAAAVRVCPAPPSGFASCLALRNDAAPQPNAATPAGLGPADIQSAYTLPAATTSAPTGPVVAIIDAYNDPTAEADLGVYRRQYGLPSCTKLNGCFRQVNQTGGTKLPRTNAGWAQEISLDVDMVSAACPSCKILLVEATSSSFTNLAAAVTYAAGQPGVKAISNSYGGSDSANIADYETAAGRGIAVVASTGDSGYGVQSPASFTHVVAVGGTSLTRDGSARGWTESAWSGAGSGCSTKNANPGWQTGTSCGSKANADVSAVADPNTGVAVYDSTPNQGASGWLVFGGTSASSPIIGSVYALAGDFTGYAGAWTWVHRSGLNDVTSGNNGTCPTATPSWCTSGIGWDGPTGLGTPNGLGAF